MVSSLQSFIKIGCKNKNCKRGKEFSFFTLFDIIIMLILNPALETHIYNFFLNLPVFMMKDGSHPEENNFSFTLSKWTFLYTFLAKFEPV